jgi:NaMN:DMB phosphoribosyltransferase
MRSDRRAERRTFDLFLFDEMRMAGTSPAMAILVGAV